jgi:hypothetical protein
LRATAFSMYGTASGVLQLVSPWSTSTLPIRRAAEMAILRNFALRIPIEDVEVGDTIIMKAFWDVPEREAIVVQVESK